MGLVDDVLNDSLMPVYPGSTILKPCEELKSLVRTLDFKSLTRISLGWIRTAKFSPRPTILPPRFRRAKSNTYGVMLSRDVRSIYTEVTEAAEMAEAEKERLINNEDQRKRSYEELELTYSTIGKAKMVERITEIDWPEGLTYSMISNLAFELIRNLQTGLRLSWSACYLDYGDDAETEALLGKKDARSSRQKLYQTITPIALSERISSELRNYVSHAIFLNHPDSDANDIPYADPFDDWTKSFTHLRIHLCNTPKQICSGGLNILHIPKTPWFLVSSGFMGSIEKRYGIKEFIYTAIAHALGARAVRHSELIKNSGSLNNDNQATWTSRKLGELRSKDPMSLREIILSEFHVVDGDMMAGRVKGGKGRLMDRNEAEDGPLVRAEKRKRVDTNGLYEEIAEKEKDRFGEVDKMKDLVSEEISKIRHPKEEKMLRRNRNIEKKKRERELNDLFGLSAENSDKTNGENGAMDMALPRVEQIRYDLYLPMPKMAGYGDVPKHVIRANPIQLRLNGTHVLAGLRNLVNAGLDGEKIEPNGQNGRMNAVQSSENQQFSKGLPEWLIDVRGTRIRVGLDEDEEEEEGMDSITSNGIDQ